MKSTPKRLRDRRDAEKAVFMLGILRQLLIPITMWVFVIVLFHYDPSLTGYSVQRGEGNKAIRHMAVETHKKHVDLDNNQARMIAAGQIIWTTDGKVEDDVDFDQQKHITDAKVNIIDTRVISGDHDKRNQD